MSSDKCPQCGASLGPRAVFCVKCGMDLKTGHGMSTDVAPGSAPPPAEEGAPPAAAKWGIAGGVVVVVVVGVAVYLGTRGEVGEPGAMKPGPAVSKDVKRQPPKKPLFRKAPEEFEAVRAVAANLSARNPHINAKGLEALKGPVAEPFARRFAEVFRETAGARRHLLLAGAMELARAGQTDVLVEAFVEILERHEDLDDRTKVAMGDGLRRIPEVVRLIAAVFAEGHEERQRAAARALALMSRADADEIYRLACDVGDVQAALEKVERKWPQGGTYTLQFEAAKPQRENLVKYAPVNNAIMREAALESGQAELRLHHGLPKLKLAPDGRVVTGWYDGSKMTFSAGELTALDITFAYRAFHVPGLRRSKTTVTVKGKTLHVKHETPDGMSAYGEAAEAERLERCLKIWLSTPVDLNPSGENAFVGKFWAGTLKLTKARK